MADRVSRRGKRKTVQFRVKIIIFAHLRKHASQKPEHSYPNVVPDKSNSYAEYAIHYTCPEQHDLSTEDVRKIPEHYGTYQHAE